MWFGFLLAILQIVLGVTVLLIVLLLLLRRGRGSLSDTLGEELTSILGGPVAAQRKITHFTVTLGALGVASLLALGLITPAGH